MPTGGHFFGEPHTLERYSTAFYQPMLSNWQNYEAWQEAGGLDATARATRLWKKALEEYVEPPMDAAVREALEAYVAKRKEEIGTESREWPTFINLESTPLAIQIRSSSPTH